MEDLTDSSAIAPVASTFWSVPELVQHAASLVSLETLTTLNLSSVHLRQSAQCTVRGRVKLLVGRFIPSAFHEEFFDLLGDTRSVIGGSTVLALLTDNEDCLAWEPADLNVFIPFSAWSRWDQFVHMHAFTFAARHIVSPRYSSGVMSHRSYYNNLTVRSCFILNL